MTEFAWLLETEIPAPAALCAGLDQGRGARRRSGAELPRARHRQAASVAAGHRSARLAVHDPAQPARQRRAPRGARGVVGPGRGSGLGADRRRERRGVAAAARPRTGDRPPAGRAAPGDPARRPRRHALRGSRHDPRHSDRHRALAPVARPRDAACADGDQGRATTPAPRPRQSRRRKPKGCRAGCCAAPRRTRGEQGSPRPRLRRSAPTPKSRGPRAGRGSAW